MKLAARSRDLVTCCLLLDAGASDLITNGRGWTAAQIARSSKNTDVRLRMKQNADERVLERKLATMMAIHPRIGAVSGMSSLNAEVMHLIHKYGVGLGHQ